MLWLQQAPALRPPSRPRPLILRLAHLLFEIGAGVISTGQLRKYSTCVRSPAFQLRYSHSLAIGRYPLVRVPDVVRPLHWDSSGSHHSADIVVSQGTALKWKHDGNGQRGCLWRYVVFTRQVYRLFGICLCCSVGGIERNKPWAPV